MAVHCPFPYKKKRPSYETESDRCLKMVLYARWVKLGNFMFQSDVDTKTCISQVKTKQAHGGEHHLGRENIKMSPSAHS